MEAFDGNATFDPETGVFVWLRNRAGGAAAGDQVGWIDSRGYRRTEVKGRMRLLHAVAWELVNGPIPEGYEIDHRDGNRQNNAISNLRLATRSQNMHNSRIRKTNKTGFKGVNWNDLHGKFQVQVMLNRRKIYCGYFATAEEANVAAMKLREAAHGEFCRHA